MAEETDYTYVEPDYNSAQPDPYAYVPPDYNSAEPDPYAYVEADYNGAATIPTPAPSALSEFGTKMFNTAKSLGSAISSFDPSTMRLGIAGLLGGASTARSGVTPVNWANAAGQVQSSGPAGEDWRIRLSLAPGAKILYNSPNAGLLQPILSTGGFIFPITPQVQVQHNAKYSAQSLTHSNYEMQFYEGSSVSAMMINGEFPIQTIEEGQYLLAAIMFFRAATKMFWGGNDPLAGTPPPIVYLDGYGEQYFPHVPCVITQFMHTLPDTVDYISVPSAAGGKATRLPLQSQLQVTVQPIYSRSNIRGFNLNDFAKGKLVGGGFI